MGEKSEYIELLGRQLFSYEPEKRFKDTFITITGAAGSVGSQLTRTLLKKTEARLILIDQNEYALNQLLIENHNYRSRIEVLLTGIQNKTILEKCFHLHRPDILIHAAAYKQVPMLETWPTAAILNNINNTEIIYELAVEAGVEKFVFISTDKVFSARNVLGKSKKIAEQLICSGKNNMQSLILRFGNVLYSSGSVTELLRDQALENKKLTLTDPEATRYFIAPEEGSDFILFTLDQELPNSIYYLYQQEQIRILDLARKIYHHYRGNNPPDEWWEKISPRPGDAMREFDLSHLKDEKIETHPMIRKIKFQCEANSNAFRKELEGLYRMASTSCAPEEMKNRLAKLSSITG